MTKEEFIKTGFTPRYLEQSFTEHLEEFGMIYGDDIIVDDAPICYNTDICQRRIDSIFEISKMSKMDILSKQHLDYSTKEVIRQRVIAYLSLNTSLQELEDKLINPIKGEKIYIHPATYEKYGIEYAKSNKLITTTNVYKSTGMQQTGAFVLAPNERLEYKFGDDTEFKIEEVDDKYLITTRINLTVRVGV